MDRRQIGADIALIGVVIIWGATFVMVQDAVMVWPVFAFLCLRFSIATLAFVPILMMRRRSWMGRPGAWLYEIQSDWRRAAGPAILAGLVLGGSYVFQTAGLLYTTPARAGFITGLNVVMVPIAAAWVLRKRIDNPTRIGVLLATVGMTLLSLNEELRVGYGEFLVFICAVCVAGQILLVAHYAGRIAPLRLATIQIGTVALSTGLVSLVVEVPGGLPPLTGTVLFAAVFTGVMATTLAFSVQAWAQRFTEPTHIALIFTLEPVAAAVASFLLIGEVLSQRALIGCALILAGMFCAEAVTLIRRREPLVS